MRRDKQINTISTFLAVYLINYRKKTNKSQEQLAMEIGISRWALSAYETEKTNTNIVHAIELISMFASLEKVDLSVFLNRMTKDLRRAKNAYRPY